jgi:hypothetical protein
VSEYWFTIAVVVASHSSFNLSLRSTTCGHHIGAVPATLSHTSTHSARGCVLGASCLCRGSQGLCITASQFHTAPSLSFFLRLLFSLSVSVFVSVFVSATLSVFTLTLTLSLALLLSHSLSHSHSRVHTHTHSHTHTPTLPHSHTLSHTNSLTHSLTISLLASGWHACSFVCWIDGWCVHVCVCVCVCVLQSVFQGKQSPDDAGGTTIFVGMLLEVCFRQAYSHTHYLETHTYTRFKFTHHTN